MPVTTEQRGSVMILLVDEAELTDHVVDPLRQAFDQAVESDCYRLVFDLHQATYADSFFLAALMSVYNEVSARAGEVKIVGLCERLQRMFAAVRLDDLFRMYDTVEEAVQAFGGPNSPE